MSALLKTAQLVRQEGLSTDLLFKMSLVLLQIPLLYLLSLHSAVKILKTVVYTAAETPGSFKPVRGSRAVKCFGSVLADILSFPKRATGLLAALSRQHLPSVIQNPVRVDSCTAVVLLPLLASTSYGPISTAPRTGTLYALSS